MTTKKYLQQAFFLNQLIKTNKEELERLREIAASVAAPDLSKERVQSSGVIDKIGNTVALIVDLEAVIQSDIDRYVRTKSEIYNLIDKIKDAELKLILQKRYLLFKKWDDIAEEMDFDVRWVYILHGKALKAAEKYIIEIHV